MDFHLLIRIRDLFRLSAGEESLNYERGGKYVLTLLKEEYKKTQHHNLHLIIHEKNLIIEGLKKHVADLSIRSEEEKAYRLAQKQKAPQSYQDIAFLKAYCHRSKLKIKFAITAIIGNPHMSPEEKIKDLKSVIKSWNLEKEQDSLGSVETYLSSLSSRLPSEYLGFSRLKTNITDDIQKDSRDSTR